MVVLIILSTMASLAVFSLEGIQNREADHAVRRLERTLQIAIETAEMRGAPISAEFQVQGYRFSTLNTSGEWQLLLVPKTLEARDWYPGMSVSRLMVNGQESLPPYRLVFGSDAPEFRLDLNTVNGPRTIRGSMSGAVEIEEQGEGKTDEETARP